MKTLDKLIKRLFILFVLSINININCFASKITRISGITSTSENQKKNSSEIPYIKLSSPEVIETVFEKVKKDDLIFYSNLVKIRNKNFDKFVSDLEKWINDYDQEKINIERTVYNNNYKSLNELLNTLSDKYKSENDKELKLKIADQIKMNINALFALTVSMDNLTLRIKKKEIAQIESALYEKQYNKINFEKKLMKQYMPDIQ